MHKSTRKNISSILGFSCSCRNSKSVSVLSLSGEKAPAPVNGRKSKEKETTFTSAESLTLTSPVHSTSSFWEETEDNEITRDLNSGHSPASFSDLIHELKELEQSVVAWKSCNTATKAVGDEEDEDDEKLEKMSSHCVKNVVKNNVVVVVKESDDPFDDFRLSMAQMIVEKEIVGVDELRELLLQFLALNSTMHHQIIFRAFVQVLDDILSSQENISDLIFSKYLRGSSVIVLPKA